MGQHIRCGTCHLCGRIGPLSFEHVPPRAAFNDRSVVHARMQDLIARDEDLYALDKIKGRVSQRGAGAYTLCGQCNSDTGAWYGNAYVEWARNGLRLIDYGAVAPSLLFRVDIFPLRVIKQVVCMFFSANGEDFQKKRRELVKFVLNREERHMPRGIRIFAYLNSSLRSRQTGVVGALSLDDAEASIFSEVSFPPWGYVMSLSAKPPDNRLVDITWFSRYAYQQWVPLDLKVPMLPVYSWVPGDYRTREQVLLETAENIEESKRLSREPD